MLGAFKPQRPTAQKDEVPEDDFACFQLRRLSRPAARNLIRSRASVADWYQHMLLFIFLAPAKSTNIFF